MFAVSIVGTERITSVINFRINAKFTCVIFVLLIAWHLKKFSLLQHVQTQFCRTQTPSISVQSRSSLPENLTTHDHLEAKLKTHVTLLLLPLMVWKRQI
jgi:hypothetical protein